MRSEPRRIPNRVIVYPKDIENITGRKPRAARKLLQNIKAAFCKRKEQFVTVQEFCAYTGIEEGIVREYLLL